MQRKPLNKYIFVDNGRSFDEGNWTALSYRFEMP